VSLSLRRRRSEGGESGVKDLKRHAHSLSRGSEQASTQGWEGRPPSPKTAPSRRVSRRPVLRVLTVILRFPNQPLLFRILKRLVQARESMVSVTGRDLRSVVPSATAVHRMCRST